MGDEHQRPVPTFEVALQPSDRFDVEVVGRFVQQQHIRPRGDHRRQQNASLHAAGHRRDFRVGGQFHLRKRLVDPVPGLPIVRFGLPTQHDLQRRPGQIFGNVLDQPDDLGTAVGRHRSAVGRQFTVQDLQKRRLAGTVAAEQTDAIAAPDVRRHAVEQRRPAEAKMKVVEAEEGHDGFAEKDEDKD